MSLRELLHLSGDLLVRAFALLLDLSDLVVDLVQRLTNWLERLLDRFLPLRKGLVGLSRVRLESALRELEKTGAVAAQRFRTERFESFAQLLLRGLYERQFLGACLARALELLLEDRRLPLCGRQGAVQVPFCSR